MGRSGRCTTGVFSLASEARKGASYDYAAKRRGGRIRKIYLGPGPAGEVSAAATADAATHRAEAAAAVAAQQSRLAGPEMDLRRLDEACDLHAATELSAAGYYRHNYSTLRRRGARIKSS